VVLDVDRVSNGKMGEKTEQIDDEGALAFVLLQHRKDEVLEVLRVASLEGLRLFVKNLLC